MTKILIISDIHSNFEALQAVLQAAGSYDSAWCLGDLVGYGPDPNECIDRVRQLPGLKCLIGNHDAAVLGKLDLAAFNPEAFASINWTKTVLTEENFDFLASLPEKTKIDQVTISHGSPRNPIWEYLLDLHTVVSNFSYFDTPYCFVGHTHIPVYYAYNGNGHVDWHVPRPGEPVALTYQVIANPGSVGQPRDRDPRASFAFYYPDEQRWELRRIEYDISAVQKRILDAGLPQRHAIRLDEGW